MRARFRDWCRVCRGDVHPGQEIAWRDGRPAHMDCVPSAEREQVREAARKARPRPVATSDPWDRRRDIA